MSMEDVRDSVRNSVEEALGVTPSVLILARLSNVKPDDLAKAFVDTDASEDYLAAFSAALVKARREQEKTEEEKKAKK